MIRSVCCTALPVALEQLKILVKNNEQKGLRTVIFCEDRLSLAAERTVCTAVEGTFSTSVFTFARFLASEYGKPQNVLSAQGSAMAVRRIIEQNRQRLSLFKSLTAPAAAQSVYDTIAMLYSSRVSPDDLSAADEGGLLGGKLKDLSLIYREYMRYLEESGLQDRNGYLKKLAPVILSSPKIKGATVVFLGYQAFTCTTAECVRAAFESARNVVGLFIGGKEDIYVNEAHVTFIGAAAEFGGAATEFVAGTASPVAEALRRSLYNPECFYSSAQKTASADVRIFEACDEEEEFEFIAAAIKRNVLDFGERYSQISVMVPDVAAAEGCIARVFSKYRIPYYADRRIPLAEHPLSAFIFSWLGCVISGCRPQDVDGVISSPYFPAERRDKDIFRNYALRLANYRGGVRREPDKTILDNLRFDYGSVERVRQIFLRGLSILTRNGSDRGIFGGLCDLLVDYGVQEKLLTLSNSFGNEYPVAAAFGNRAYDGVLSVLKEAEALSAGMNLKDISKILKSGFTAMEISLIPPKADAVFVGDIAATPNTGSNVVFAAGLSGDVPAASTDTSLLSDREISLLEGFNMNISPKIRQVNLRKRETAALNVCSFRRRLYLSYSTRVGGEERTPSEIIAYARAVIAPLSGKELAVTDVKKFERDPRILPYFAGEKLPAIKQLLKPDISPAAKSAVFKVLRDRGFGSEAEAALKKRVRANISCGKQLYLTYNSVTPTALETYFSCPYLGFMRQGLKVQEREEGAVRPTDTGNFIHSVLEETAKEVNDIRDMSTLKMRAEEIAQAKLSKPPYSSLFDVKSGQYTAQRLKEEAVAVCAGMYEQLKNSRFAVSTAEGKCEINLAPGVKLFGRIDRVDQCGDMVRIIDYKTGVIDSSPIKYYMGVKLQLPLYLLAVSGGKRAVGAYYFPAAVEYRDKPDGVFRLQGFMDGSEDVVIASDTTVKPKKKSEYFDAYLNGKKMDCAMEREQFAEFLNYSRLVAKKGAEEMLSGNITPSPAETACKYCRMGGSCGFAPGIDGEERSVNSVNCATIAKIASEEKDA